MTSVLSREGVPAADTLRRALDRSGLLEAPGESYPGEGYPGESYPGESYTVVVGGASEPWVEDALDRAAGNGRTVVVAVAGAHDPVRTWELLSRGAEDVLPWDGEATTDQVIHRVARWRRVDAALRSPTVTGRFVGRSRALRAALTELVELAMFSRGPVLLTGETGTGKELASEVVHELSDPPPEGPLVVVDCTTIVPTLSGSELFGHERGAFTGADRARAGAVAAADGGTLFLDEVGDLPLGLQAELLRVVQEHTFKRVGGDAWARSDFRLVSATNRDLRRDQERGRFRRDLYHRLAAGVVRLPPLRERPEDLQPLFRHFLAEASGHPSPDVTPSVLAMLQERDYPGNLRELRQLATRVAARHAGAGPVTPGDLPPADRPRPREPAASPTATLEAAVRESLHAGTRLQELKATVGDLALAIALQDAGGNAHAAAQRLGVTDRAVQKRRQTARRGVPPESPAGM